MSRILDSFRKKSVKIWSIVAVVVVAVIAAGRINPTANASNSTVGTEAKVVMLDVAETIEASGSLEAQPFASLSWKTSGVVESVNIQPGDFVKADEILLTLQPSSTSASLVSAQADLVNNQKDLEDLLNSETNFAQAVIDMEEAQEEYDDAVSYLEYLQDEDKIPQTETHVYLQNTPRGYQYVYKVKSFKGPATEDMLTEAENDLALKQAQLDDAQREYDRLKDGPNAQDVIAAQAKVDAAQTTVNSLSIIAPFDGEVLSVEDHAGDTVNAGELSVNIADLNHLYVETQVDESDIAKVKLGNQAEVTLDAVPGVTLTGRVTAINPVGEDVSGLVKYTVRVDLDKVKDEIFLPLGTTANVVIKVKEASASLAVPISAVKNDAAGEYVWLIQSDGTTKRVDVISGAIVGDQVVVTGDLKEGDRIQMVHENNLQSPGFGGGK